jgi:hypothetical protein
MKPAIEKGEKCYNARLTAEQVHEARILVMKGPIGTLPQIARRWGVEKQTLRNAVAGNNWKWLPLPTAEEIENTPLAKLDRNCWCAASLALRHLRPLVQRQVMHYANP